jgi:hypothetical protein
MLAGFSSLLRVILQIYTGGLDGWRDRPAEGVDCHSGECVYVSALHHHDVEQGHIAPRELPGRVGGRTLATRLLFLVHSESRRNLVKLYCTTSTEQAARST